MELHKQMLIRESVEPSAATPMLMVKDLGCAVLTSRLQHRLPASGLEHDQTCLLSALQKAAAAADRAGQEAARLREQLAGLQRAVDAANPTAATTAASQVRRQDALHAGLHRRSCRS